MTGLFRWRIALGPCIYRFFYTDPLPQCFAIVRNLDESSATVVVAAAVAASAAVVAAIANTITAVAAYATLR